MCVFTFLLIWYVTCHNVLHTIWILLKHMKLKCTCHGWSQSKYLRTHDLIHPIKSCLSNTNHSLRYEHIDRPWTVQSVLSLELNRMLYVMMEVTKYIRLGHHALLCRISWFLFCDGNLWTQSCIIHLPTQNKGCDDCILINCGVCSLSRTCCQIQTHF